MHKGWQLSWFPFAFDKETQMELLLVERICSLKDLTHIERAGKIEKPELSSL